MRPLFRPAFTNVLPIGTTHGTDITTTDFVVNGYNWSIEGNRAEPWSVLSSSGGDYDDGTGNGWFNDLTAYLKLSLPVPIQLTGCQFTYPKGASGSDVGAQITFEGLDRSSDPNGVWRVLLASISVESSGVGSGTATAAFTGLFPVEELRIRSAEADNPSYGFARGFRFGKILSLY